MVLGKGSLVQRPFLVVSDSHQLIGGCLPTNRARRPLENLLYSLGSVLRSIVADNPHEFRLLQFPNR